MVKQSGTRATGFGETDAGYLAAPVAKPRSFTYREVETGIPAADLRDLIGHGLTRDDIRLVIPDRTLDRRIAKGEALKPAEADGIARLLRVRAHALRLYDGREELADLWLRLPNPALGDQIPIVMARTDIGAREVETILGRLEHGVYS